jgi:hypothetical protein
MRYEEAPVNAIGGGNIAGTAEAGDDPPVRKRPKIIRRKKFAGCEVFEVDSDRYNRCTRAKLRYERFSKFVGEDDTAMAIREYARTNPAKGIMIQDGATGSMTYLKLPRGKTGVQF